MCDRGAKDEGEAAPGAQKNCLQLPSPPPAHHVAASQRLGSDDVYSGTSTSYNSQLTHGGYISQTQNPAGFGQQLTGSSGRSALDVGRLDTGESTDFRSITEIIEKAIM